MTVDLPLEGWACVEQPAGLLCTSESEVDRGDYRTLTLFSSGQELVVEAVRVHSVRNAFTVQRAHGESAPYDTIGWAMIALGSMILVVLAGGALTREPEPQA